MLERAGVPRDETVDEGHLGFQLGPRLNAPGRLGTADPSLRLLRALSGAEASPLAAQVEAMNQRRRASQDEVVEQAREQLEADPKTPSRHALVAHDERWLPGIVGIAASNLVERFRRPALVLAVDRELGEARGSARTFGRVDIRAALHACAALLDRFGGHKAAAGVSLRPDRIPAFVEAFDDAVAKQTGGTPPDDRVEYDGEVGLARIDARFLADLRRLAPYGMGFAPPLFLCEGAKVVRSEIVAARHLKLWLEQSGTTREAMLFGRTDLAPDRGDLVSLLFTPTNARRGPNPQLRVQDLWRAGT
jgi:single-stranded-DNA-specific exonuclease